MNNFVAQLAHNIDLQIDQPEKTANQQITLNEAVNYKNVYSFVEPIGQILITVSKCQKFDTET